MPHIFENKADYDMTYPPGVKELNDDLPIEELVKRLKICANVLQNLGQNDNVSCYENFALHIASEEFLTHMSKEVRLLVACIIVDIFRLYAPDPPYKEPQMIKNIFLFLVEELKGIKNPFNVYFKRHFYILEILAWLKAFNICFDVEEGLDIFCSLFKLFFSSINDQHTTKVKNYMLDIMSSILLDIDTIPNELLETILLCIIEPHKSQKRESYILAKDLIKRVDKVMEPYVQQYFTNVLFPEKDKEINLEPPTNNGVSTESENLDNVEGGDEANLKNDVIVDGQKPPRKCRIALQAKRYRDARVYDFIYELYLIQPNLLANIVPLLEFKLKSDKIDDRVSATKALGRIFSEKDFNLAQEHPGLWKSFLGRFNDIDVNVRLICVRYVSHLLINHNSTSNSSIYANDEIDVTNELAGILLARAFDPEESVRLELVNSLVQVGARTDLATIEYHQHKLVGTQLTGSTDMVSTSFNVLDDHDGSLHQQSVISTLLTEYKCPLILNIHRGLGCESEILLECLKSRTLDKKFRIRKDAMMGLGAIYKLAYNIAGNATHCASAVNLRKKLFWIRDQIMHSYYQNTAEDQILVERIFNTCFVPFNLSAHKKMYRLLHFFVNIDEHSVKALTELWKKHYIFRNLTLHYIFLKDKDITAKLEKSKASFTTSKDASRTVPADDTESIISNQTDLLNEGGTFHLSTEAETRTKIYRDRLLQKAHKEVNSQDANAYIGAIPPKSFTSTNTAANTIKTEIASMSGSICGSSENLSTMDDNTSQSINTKLYQISKMLPDCFKVFELLKKFDTMLSEDPKLFKSFKTLISDPTISCKDVCTLCKAILKKLGNPQATNVIHTYVKQYLERTASLMIDKESILALCVILEESGNLLDASTPIYPFLEDFVSSTTLPDDRDELIPGSVANVDTTSTSPNKQQNTNVQKPPSSSSLTIRSCKSLENFKGDKSDFIRDRGFQLLKILSCVFINCFHSPDILSSLNKLLLLQPTKDISSKKTSGHKAVAKTTYKPVPSLLIDSKVRQNNIQVLINVIKHWKPAGVQASKTTTSSKKAAVSSEDNDREMVETIMNVILPNLKSICYDGTNSKLTKYAITAFMNILNHPFILSKYYESEGGNPTNTIPCNKSNTEADTYKQKFINELYKHYLSVIKKGVVTSEQFINALSGLAQMMLLNPLLSKSVAKEVLPILEQTFETSSLIFGSNNTKTSTISATKTKGSKGAAGIEANINSDALQDDVHSMIINFPNLSSPTSQAYVLYIKFRCKFLIAYFQANKMKNCHRDNNGKVDEDIEIVSMSPDESSCENLSGSNPFENSPNTTNGNEILPLKNNRGMPIEVTREIVAMTKNLYSLLFDRYIAKTYIQAQFDCPMADEHAVHRSSKRSIPNTKKQFAQNITENEFTLLKLKCACAVLKLVQIPFFWECLPREQFQALAYLLRDVTSMEFKHKLIFKLHKALLALKLPLEYLSIFCLVNFHPPSSNPSTVGGYSSSTSSNTSPPPTTSSRRGTGLVCGEHSKSTISDQKDFKARCKQYLSSNITKRRELIRTNPTVMQNKMYTILPDYVLPYAIHLLAHAPDFRDINDVKYLLAIKEALWFIIEPLIHKNENYSFSFFKRLIENIKQTKDAQTPNSSDKLYAVCDIALGLIWTRSSSFVLKDYPAKPILPSKLFIKTANARPNSKLYLPSEYEFSPSKRKVTRPEMCQFFSLVQTSSTEKLRATRQRRELESQISEQEVEIAVDVSEEGYSESETNHDDHENGELVDISVQPKKKLRILRSTPVIEQSNLIESQSSSSVYPDSSFPQSMTPGENSNLLTPPLSSQEELSHSEKLVAKGKNVGEQGLIKTRSRRIAK